MPLGAARLTLLAFQPTVAVEAEVIRKKIGVSALGNAQVDTAQSKFGGASALFDGTGDYLSMNVASSYDDDFTIETWVRLDVLPSSGTFRMLFAGNSNTEYASIANQSGTYVSNLVIRNSGGSLYETYYTIPSISTNTWYHWAVVKSGSTIKHFFDGTELTTLYSSTGTMGSDYGFDGYHYLARWNGNTSHMLDGYMDEVRISDTARYTTGFTPSTTPFANDDNTKLLLHMNGTDASTFFEDDNGVRAESSLVGLGGADIDTAQSKFGGTSFYVDGTGGDGVLAYLPSNPTAITVEGWYKFDGIPSSKSCMFAHNRASTGYGAREWFLTYNYVLNDWSLNMKDDTSTTVTRINSTANDHEDTNWHHMAICMEIGGYARLFIDGDLEEEVDISGYTFTDWTSGNNNIWLGHWYASSNNHECYYDEFRISDSIRYTTSFTAPTAPFTNDSNTIMLLHADGTNGSQVFRDDNGHHTAGRTAVQVSAVNDAQVDTAQSKFGGSSLLTDRTTPSDYISVSNNASSLDLGSGDWTIEFFMRPTSLPGSGAYHFIYDSRNASGDTSPNIGLTNSKVFFYTAGGFRITGSTTLSTNTMYHVALVKSGSTTTLYLDGTSDGTYSDSNTYIADDTVNIGANFSGANGFTGNLDEFRISNSARYTAAFTAPTAPFVDDANTLLLLHMDGADGSTSFVDDVGGRSSIGVSAVNDAQIDTAQYKFGGASAYFDGTDDRIVMDNTKFDFGSSDFTIEMWIRDNSSATNYSQLFANWGAAPPSTERTFGLYLKSTNGLTFFYYDTSNTLQTLNSTSTVTNLTWTHVAFVVNSGNYEFFIDGTSAGSGSITAIRSIADSGLYTSIGSDITNLFDFNGWIDEVRISDTARYTSAFTAPTEPFQNDANTLLLLHMDGTDGSTVFIDDNGKQA